MGIIGKGILGGFSGKVGTVIGATWKGIDYMKSRPPARGNADASQKQLAQQAKFSLAMKFITTLSSLFQISYRNYAIGKTGTNSAFSYLLTEAIAGSYPDFSIDYSKMLMSRGQLPNASAPAATAAAGGDIVFTWTDNTGISSSKASDQAMLVIYCPALKTALYTTGSAMRNSGTDKLDAMIFAGHLVETYIGFISEDGKKVANSIYTGQHTVLS